MRNTKAELKAPTEQDDHKPDRVPRRARHLAIAAETPELAIVPRAPRPLQPITIDGRPIDKRMLGGIALHALRAGVAFMKSQLDGTATAPQPKPLQLPSSDRDVMTADEVAAFLGVDRNTVYDYAGRGMIPHQRLGKRILFRRGGLVSWLDSSCKATSTRKG